MQNQKGAIVLCPENVTSQACVNRLMTLHQGTMIKAWPSGIRAMSGQINNDSTSPCNYPAFVM